LNNLFGLALLILAEGQEPSPRFSVISSSEKRLTGTIEKMDADGSVTLSKEATSAGQELVGLRRALKPMPHFPRTAQAVLNNGDRIAGTPSEIDGSFLWFRAVALRTGAEGKIDRGIRLPVTWVSIVWLRSPDSIDPEKLIDAFPESRTNDRAILGNGDVIAGTLTGLDAKKGELQFDMGAEKKIVALSKVVAIAFNNRVARNRKPTGSFGHLVLTTGTRLTVISPRIADNVLTAQTMFKDSIGVPLTAISALDIYQGAATYLSDLKPARYQYHTYQGEEHDWMADRNLAGQELQLRTELGTETFDKGVAVHGACRLTYALDGKYRRFECLAGLDAQLGKRGSVDIRVLVDGREQSLGDAKSLTFANGSRRIGVNIKDAKELTLIVEWGEGGNVGDYVNWCDARLLR
jgi:hypothetical protein